VNTMNDKQGHNALYKDQLSELSAAQDIASYIELFEKKSISPYWKGGGTKGYVRGVAVKALIREADKLSKSNSSITILDAGCGQGELSVYLACKGYNVIGIDISEEGCRMSRLLAGHIGVQNVEFKAESLESISIKTGEVDFVIGHASLHHFIKYEGCSSELYRVLRPGGQMFFADSFGENFVYHLFHNKEQMERLGDVMLTKKMIEDYFQWGAIKLYPTDWLVMLDKLLLKALSNHFTPLVRKISFVWWCVDRCVPKSRWALALSGSVFTHVKKNI